MNDLENMSVDELFSLLEHFYRKYFRAESNSDPILEKFYVKDIDQIKQEIKGRCK